MFANCSLAGTHLGFPDVCKTPAGPAGLVPVPYPNVAMLPMAVPATVSRKLLISMMPAHTVVTTIPMSSGDNPGVGGGVASGIIMGPARNLLGSAKVFSGGLPVTTWLKPTLQNQTNCPGMTMVPSQFKMMILS